MLTPAEKQRAYRQRQREQIAKMDAEAAAIGARVDGMEAALRRIIELTGSNQKPWAVEMRRVAREALGEEGKA